MSKPVQVGLAQDHTNIRVGDQQATLVHHVGRTGFANMDSRDDIPNEFQIHLRDGDARATPGPGNRHREIGLRFFAEIDGAHITLIGSRMGKLRLLAQIGTPR